MQAGREGPPTGSNADAPRKPVLEAGRVHFGLKWTALSLFTLRFGRFLTTIVLARLLTKEMFGLVTMSMAFILAFQALRDIGFGQAYVQRRGLSPEEDHRAASTVFWVTAGLNIGMFAVAFALAPFAASWFPKLEGLTPILRGTFAVLLVEAVSMAPTAVLQKRLEFGHVAAGEMVSVAVNFALAITLALLGFGAWSVVLGNLGARAAQAGVILYSSRFRPRFQFDVALARELAGFGKYLWGTSMLNVSNKVVDKFLLGRVAGDAALGVYGNAYNLCTTTSKPLYSIVVRVAFPALARLQDDPIALRNGFTRAVSSIALLTVPLAVGLAVTARDFVVTVYGAKWADMAPITEVLAFYGLVMSLAAITGPVLLATGRTRHMFFFAATGQALMIGGLLLADGYGLRAVAFAVLASSLLAEGIAFCFAASRLGLRPWQALAPLARSAAAAAAMATAVVACQVALEAAPPPVRLALEAAVGVAAYGAASWLVNRDDAQRAFGELRRIAGARGRQGPSTAAPEAEL